MFTPLDLREIYRGLSYFLSVDEHTSLSREGFDYEISVDRLRIGDGDLNSFGSKRNLLGNYLRCVTLLTGFEVVYASEKFTGPGSCTLPLTVCPDLGIGSGLEGNCGEVGPEARTNDKCIVVCYGYCSDCIAVLLLRDEKFMFSAGKFTIDERSVADEFVVDIYCRAGNFFILVDNLDPAVGLAKVYCDLYQNR